mgnify:CR=1 FL=1
MKPHQRKQIPRQLYALLLCEPDQDNAIEIFIGDCKPYFSPFFDDKDRLCAVFYSWQTKFIHTRVKQQNKKIKWPQERIFINVTKLRRYWLPKMDTIADDIIFQNNLKSSTKNVIDPSRDARFIWDKPNWMGSAACTNIDTWADITLARINNLKNGTEKAILNPLSHMGILGVMIAVVSCLDKRADSVTYLHEFDDIIGQEADTFLSSELNYAWNFDVMFKSDVKEFPYMDFLTETMVVKLAVPEYLAPLLKIKHKVPFWKGVTYVGIKKFKLFARILFISEWKLFALRLLALIPSPSSDPAFNEFCSKVKLQPTIVLNSTPILQTSANLLFPKVSPHAPPCMQKLFVKPPLKHYARWQLGEISVDMGWSLNNLLTYYTDTPANRREVTANYHSYRKKIPPRNRCKIFKQKDLCPYDNQTFHLCASAGNSSSPLPDIEDLSPALFFQHRLQLAV